MSKVDLNDAPFVEFAKHRQSWALEDHFINPGMTFVFLSLFIRSHSILWSLCRLCDQESSFGREYIS